MQTVFSLARVGVFGASGDLRITSTAVHVRTIFIKSSRYLKWINTCRESGMSKRLHFISENVIS